MKDILESRESFTAHAMISYGYFMLNQFKELSDKEKLLEREDWRDVIDKIIDLIEIIIENKKIIDVDITNDMNTLDSIYKLKEDTEHKLNNL